MLEDLQPGLGVAQGHAEKGLDDEEIAVGDDAPLQRVVELAVRMPLGADDHVGPELDGGAHALSVSGES